MEKEIRYITFGACDFDDYIEIPQPIQNTNKKGLVEFGTDNRFPQYLYECYSNCSLLQSLCNGLTDYVCGNGITDDQLDELKVNDTMTLSELVKKTTLDYTIFGAFAVQVVRNHVGRVVQINYLDVQKCRLSEDENTVYVNSNWDKWSRNTIEYKRWSSTQDYPDSIFYFKSPKSRSTYGMPIWSSAIKDIQTDIEITQFHLSTIQNGFFSPFIINMNNGEPTEERGHEIEREIVKKFTGTKKAGRFILSFNNSKEQAADIVGVPSDNFDQKYNALSDKVKENILTSFRASAQLFGVSSQATGFSAIEYKNSFALFNTTVVQPMQREVERAYKMLGFDFTLDGFKVEFDEE